MTDVARALNGFWNGFLPAYVEDMVPDDAEFPYITYTVADPDWNESASIQARLWYKGRTLVPMNAKAAEIKQAIGEGISIKTETGHIVIFRDANFAQFQPYDDPGKSNFHVIYLSMILQSYTRR